jgi:hypothetical protein
MAPPGLPLLAVVVLLAGCARAPESEACKSLSRFDPEAAAGAAHTAFQAGQPQFLAVRGPAGTTTPGAPDLPSSASTVIADESQTTLCPDVHHRAYAYAQRYNEALLSEQALQSFGPGP